ncbi:hypothetical protein HYW76_01710 [Candidatus Pacearchaeota archaeon]|nr:hypothetical protein [Candidatus Pacearchaeota archaeon]
MKTIYGILVMALLALSVIPGALAVSIGSGIGLDITPEQFAPRIWMCDSRIVLEDPVEAGRISNAGTMLVERVNNYAFEGEQIQWRVLAMDKNKIEEIQEVVGTIGPTQGTGNDIEVECVRENAHTDGEALEASCNARILEEQLTEFDAETMDYYTCTFTVETPASMHGEYFITGEAIGTDGQSAIMDENEYWFLNPVIALSIDGDMTFSDVRPGSIAYSSTMLVGNDAEAGSGVLLDMFISGTDFYDPASSGARCPTTNHLKLSLNLREQAALGAGILPGATFSTDCDIDTWINTPAERSVDNHDHLCYYATSGAYGTAGNANADAEGYKPIVYSNEFTRDFYRDAEIIQGIEVPGSNGFYPGNFLTPGAEIAITFKLGLPEPCVGDFSEGQIYFWGEAI